MPVGFLTQEQRDGFGRYVDPPSREELERYFHLSDDDHKAFLPLRGEHNRLGYATQLTSVRPELALNSALTAATPGTFIHIVMAGIGLEEGIPNVLMPAFS